MSRGLNKKKYIYYIKFIFFFLSRIKVKAIEVARINPAVRHKFEKRWKQLSQRKVTLGRVRINLCFHGTRIRNYPSILKEGLIVPGSNGVRVVNGNIYGKGIYVATNPMISLHFSDQNHLLVCGVLLGDWFVTSRVGQIIVVGSSSQVIPCFIVTYHDESSVICYYPFFFFKKSF